MGGPKPLSETAASEDVTTNNEMAHIETKAIVRKDERK